MAQPHAVQSTTGKEKGLVSVIGNKPLNQVTVWLEAQLQTELQLTRIERAGGLAKVAALEVVVRSTTGGSEDEVGTVEYVETVGVELQVDPFRELENLGHGHIRCPVPRTNE